MNALVDDVFKCEVYNIASNDTRKLSEFVEVMKDITGSKSELHFGGYDPEKDMNLNPDMRKTESVVMPLMEWKFEVVIRESSAI